MEMEKKEKKRLKADAERRKQLEEEARKKVGKSSCFILFYLIFTLCFTMRGGA